MVTWILVAHRAGARLYKSRGPGAELVLLDSMDHPQGRALDREIDSDRPGRLFKLGSPARSAIDPERDSHEVIAEAWARQLATTLEHGRTAGEFDNLILVAEPKFLGKLNAALDPVTVKMVVATLRKDLSNIADRDLGKHLGDLMEVWQTAMMPTGT